MQAHVAGSLDGDSSGGICADPTEQKSFSFQTFFPCTLSPHYEVESTCFAFNFWKACASILHISDPAVITGLNNNIVSEC